MYTGSRGPALLLEKALRLLEEQPCIGDAHVHVLDGVDAGFYARMLHEEYGVGLAQAMEIRPPVDRIASLPRSLLSRAWSLAEPVLSRLAPWLLEHYGGPDRMLAETLVFLSRFTRLPRGGHSGPGARLLVYADPRPSLPAEDAAAEAEKALGEGAAGLKIITTFHLTWLTSPSVEAAVEQAAAKASNILVHVGCDPGIWELPAFCSLGKPGHLDALASQYRDAVFIIAHLGGYSAAAPGVFTSEALEIARRHPNVYLDTSAVPLEVIEMALKSLGPLAGEKLLHASDYPVVEQDNPARSAARVIAALLSTGNTARHVIEKILYMNLEEVTGESCRPAQPRVSPRPSP